jgi:hypothetical protein
MPCKICEPWESGSYDELWKTQECFDPIDVVEKDDMIQIFCNSGRLVLRPDDPQGESGRQR